MSSDILQLSGAERAHPAWTDDDQAPKAGDVLYESGMTLAITLAFALLVNLCLWAAGVPSP